MSEEFAASFSSAMQVCLRRIRAAGPGVGEGRLTTPPGSSPRPP
jgi:hypothetical protein